MYFCETATDLRVYIGVFKPEIAEAVSQRNPSAWLEAKQYAAPHDRVWHCSQSRDRKRARAFDY